jgi:hypothetical protein
MCLMCAKPCPWTALTLLLYVQTLVHVLAALALMGLGCLWLLMNLSAEFAHARRDMRELPGRSPTTLTRVRAGDRCEGVRMAAARRPCSSLFLVRPAGRHKWHQDWWQQVGRAEPCRTAAGFKSVAECAMTLCPLCGMHIG